MSAIEQFLRDVRIARHVFELLRRAVDAVEVGAEADVIDAGHLDDVLDVIDDVMHAAARDRDAPCCHCSMAGSNLALVRDISSAARGTTWNMSRHGRAPSGTMKPE